MKYILEYEEADIRSLMGSLDSIGQMNPYKGTLWARFNTYRLMSDYWTYNPEYVCFLETETFYGTGDEDKDKTIMLEMIQRGQFKRPNHPSARSWASLGIGNKVAVDLMEKRRVQSLSKTCTDIDDLIEELRESLVDSQKYVLAGQLNKTRYPYSEEAASTVLVYGFIGPQNSPYLVTGDLDRPFEKGSGINYYSK